jgi:hypothetical protein
VSLDQHAPHLERLDEPAPLRAPRLTRWAAALVVGGLVSFACLLTLGLPERAWAGLLQGMMVPTWLSLGALFFIAAHAVGNARWTIPIRRVMEGLSAGIPLTFAAFIGLALFGLPHLYEWADTGADRRLLFHAHDGSKDQWMTAERCIATTGVIIVLWLWLRSNLVRLSLQQDQRADIIARHVRWSVIFLLVFAFTFTLFVWDLLLSLQIHFASSMWGIYCFVGAIQAFLAVLALVLAWLGRGPLKQVVRPHILHDVGTWTVAWSCIWAYIAYAQYVIVYYANMNEESYFYLMRSQHGYGACYVLAAFLRFPIPFLGLLSQRVRNDPRVLSVVAGCVLLGCWIDLSWIIMPAIFPNQLRGFWAIPELLIGAGFVGAYLLLAMRFWKRNGLIPRGDPRLLSSINAEHLH